MAVASIAVVATCSALFALLYVHSSRLAAEIAVSRQVAQGEIIERSDLRQVDVALSGGVSAVPVSDADQVIGKPAAVTLLAGSLLTPSDIGGLPALSSGQSIVGMDLKPGMLPAAGVEVGESVLVVLTGPAGTPVTGNPPTQTGKSGAPGQSKDVTVATVVGVDTSPGDSGAGDVVVSVQVPLTSASLVANWSAAGQVALVQIGGSP
ncbi:MAG: SAF domain-containing protein [Acidimicrobiales bacterium]